MIQNNNPIVSKFKNTNVSQYFPNLKQEVNDLDIVLITLWSKEEAIEYQFIVRYDEIDDSFVAMDYNNDFKLMLLTGIPIIKYEKNNEIASLYKDNFYSYLYIKKRRIKNSYEREN